MTVQAIKEVILALSREDRIELEEWLADRWDAELERDFSEGGGGSALIERVDAEMKLEGSVQVTPGDVS